MNTQKKLPGRFNWDRGIIVSRGCGPTVRYRSDAKTSKSIGGDGSAAGTTSADFKRRASGAVTLAVSGRTTGGLGALSTKDWTGRDRREGLHLESQGVTSSGL